MTLSKDAMTAVLSCFMDTEVGVPSLGGSYAFFDVCRNCKRNEILTEELSSTTENTSTENKSLLGTL